MTFVEITGTNFQNKGAELMLLAVAEECRRRGVDPVVQPWNGPYLQRAPLGLFQKAHYQRFGIAWDRGAHMLPRRLRHQYGIVEDREIFAVLDASGFQLGDQWGEAIAMDFAARIEASARRGQKVILLPQAFGPLKNAGVRSAARIILDTATLIFARDPDSYRFLREIAPDNDKIRIAPDFTNLVGASLPNTEVVRGAACILPNQRMLDKSDSETARSYVDFLVEVARQLKANGYPLISLVHETKTDLIVLNEINGRLGYKIPAIEICDARQAKGVLGHCELVVASRFHALASALSQGVPCIATGWNHKYRHLMEDYGCADWLLDPSPAAGTARVRELLVPARLAECRKRIAEHAPGLKKKSEDMWDLVFNELSGGAVETN